MTLFLSACAPAQQPPPIPPAAERSDPATAEHERPRLLVAVVVDQLGSDTLRSLAPLLSPDGFHAHALRSGVVYDRVVYPYAATLTAPGHAMLFSGAVPASSGVASNSVLDRTSEQPRATIDDGVHAVLGVPGRFAAPTVLRVDTVADALRIATNGRGKVVSLSMKDRSAILPAGRKPDLVLWYECSLRGFTTSTWYASSLPDWLVEHQRTNPFVAGTWQVADPGTMEALLGPDAAPGEGAYKGLDTSFPHEPAASEDPCATWRLTPASTDALLELALASVEHLHLGEDDVPDLLAISISGTDYAGHVFGPHSWEYADHLRQADRALGALYERLRQRTTVAMLVTSDHGVAPLPERIAHEHTTAARLDDAALLERLELAAAKAAGTATDSSTHYVLGYIDNYVVLTNAARRHPRRMRIRDALLAALRAEPSVARAYDSERADRTAAVDDLDRAVQQSLGAPAVGDFFVVPVEYVVPEIDMTPGRGTTHGSPWRYDTEVPALLLAPGTRPGRHGERLDAARVASTLAALLGVPAPLAETPPPLPGVEGH